MSALESDLDKTAIKSLDDMRARMRILMGALNGMISAQIENKGQLLPPGSLQSFISRISQEFKEITQLYISHQDLLASTVVTPSLTFSSAKISTLDTLLRSKMEPQSSDWIEQGQRLAEEQTSKQILGIDDLTQLWRSVPNTAYSHLMSHPWHADYTLAEKKAGIENVVTGLERELEEPETPPPIDGYGADGDTYEDVEEEEEEDDDEEAEEDGQDENRMDVERRPGQAGGNTGIPLSTQPAMPIDSILRFMTKGSTT